MKNPRTKHSPALKAKVALAAVQEQQTVAQISRRYGVHPNQVYKWKKELLDNVASVFERPASSSNGNERQSELLEKIGELTVERDFLSRGLGRLG